MCVKLIKKRDISEPSMGVALLDFQDLGKNVVVRRNASAR
jgi:hypothetical protein